MAKNKESPHTEIAEIKKNFLDLFLLNFLLKLQIFLNCLQKYIICYSIFGNLFDFFTFCKIKKQKLCENIAILC